MKNYYLKNGTKVTGPFVIDDLKYQRISENTLVSIDQGAWKKVREVNDLKSMIEFAGVASDPFPITPPKTETIKRVKEDLHRPPKKLLVVTIALAVFLLGLGMALILFMELK